MSDLGRVLLDLLPVLVGFGFAVGVRFAGVWIGLYEVRQSQRLIGDALKLTAAAQAQASGGAPPVVTPTEQTLARIAAALEAQLEVSRGNRWETVLNYLAQTAIVVGGVLAVAALLRH